MGRSFKSQMAGGLGVRLFRRSFLIKSVPFRVRYDSHIFSKSRQSSHGKLLHISVHLK